MYSHAPEDYPCPFCRIVQEIATGENTDFVYQNSHITAFMSLHEPFVNPGHVLIVPNEHYENIFDLPVRLATDIHVCSRAIALAMKAAYQCEGISLRQHNEPAGGQDVWHYHLHIFPRYTDDGFSRTEMVATPKEKRAGCAVQLRANLGNWITPG